MLYTYMGKTKSTIVMDEDLWKRFRMIAILNDMEISELVEQALKEKLERMKQLEQYDSYQEVGKLRLAKEQSQIQTQQPESDAMKQQYAKLDRIINNMAAEKGISRLLAIKRISETRSLLGKVEKSLGLSYNKAFNIVMNRWDQLSKDQAAIDEDEWNRREKEKDKITSRH